MCKKKLKEVAKLLKMMGCIRSAAESAQQARSGSPPHFQAGLGNHFFVWEPDKTKPADDVSQSPFYSISNFQTLTLTSGF